MSENQTETVDLMSGDWELAGEHMKLKHTGNSITVEFQKEASGRRCGGCTLCCKLLPVPRPPLNKPAGVRCKHQRHTGCGIYATRPMTCKSWACRWVMDDPETHGLKRPDRGHYVVDMTDDYVELVQEDGTRHKLGVIQVWVDPAFRDAYKAPELRAYMLDIAMRYRAATVIRYSSTECFTIFPPPLADDGQWHERRDGTVRDRTDLERHVLELANSVVSVG